MVNTSFWIQQIFMYTKICQALKGDGSEHTIYKTARNITLRVILAIPQGQNHEWNKLETSRDSGERARYSDTNYIPLNQEKIRGQRGRLQAQALGYVNSTKVIFGDISRTEVCFPRRPH